MSETAKKGQWVRIHNTVLKVGERAPQVPDETKAVPLEMWINGFLLDDEAKVGDMVKIRSLAERTHEGEMVDASPRYNIGYGQPQPELLAIGPELRAILKEVKNG